MGHFQRDCPNPPRETPGRSSGKVSSLVVKDTGKRLEEYSTEDLEKVLAERKAGAEQFQLEGTASVDTVTVSTVEAKGSLPRVCVEVEGLPVEAVVDTGAQCTVISRDFLRSLGSHMRERKMELPRCTPPSLKLFGRGGGNGQELVITAEVPFHFSLDGFTTHAPVFVQPGSDIQCLLGMNVIPSLGTRVERTGGEVIVPPTALKPSESAEAKVYLVQSVRIQGRKGTILEAEFGSPAIKETDSLLFEPDQDLLTSIGIVSVDALLPGTNEGKVLVPLENHYSVAADLESGLCIGKVTVVPESELTGKSAVNQAFEEPPLVGEVNQVVSSDRVSQVLDLLSLQQGTLTSEQLVQLEQLIRQNADVFALTRVTWDTLPL